MTYLNELSDFLKEVLPILHILLGGLLAILGGMIGKRLEAKYARKIRMDQIIAERTVDASAQAYAYMKDIEGRLIQDTLENIYTRVLKREGWLITSRLYLPGKFPDKWFAIRNRLAKAIRRERQLSTTGTQKTVDELQHLEKELKRLVEDAILEIYKEMKLPRIKPE
jgi:hypothetical protein